MEIRKQLLPLINNKSFTKKIPKVKQETLNTILADHLKWLRSEDGAIYADLTSADLTGANLTGANLRGAKLTSADLRGADLRGAKLTSANLRGADLTGANLTGANLRGAKLTSADLRGADLRGAKLTSADLTGADLTGANLTGANLRGAKLTSADLTGANLTGANLTGADLTSADLTSANLTGANLRGADLRMVKNLLDGIDFLEKNFEQTNEGIIAYKTFNGSYQPNPAWLIAEGSVISEICNPNPGDDCGCGINIAPIDWVKTNYRDGAIWKVLIKWTWLSGVVIPYRTDGKIRASRVQLLHTVGR